MYLLLTAVISSNDISLNVISKILCIFPIVGVLLIISGVMKFLVSILNDNPENRIPSMLPLIVGVPIITMPTIFKTYILQETSEEATNQVVENTVETFSDTIEVTNDSGNIIGVILGIILVLLILGALLIYIYNKIGRNNLFLSDDKIIHEEEENTSTTYTLDDFNQFILTTSGEVKKKCEWISQAIQFLESKEKDTSKLYSYYLPELVHILTQSDNISPANKILNQSNKNITKIQLDALQTVIDELKQMLQEYIDKEIMEVECNASVMKTVSHLD